MGDKNALRRGDKANACDGELAGEDYHDDPDAAPALAHECEQSGGGEHFIGERIEKFAENGDKIILSCDLAVEHIGQRRDRENSERDYVMIRELNKHQREINGREEHSYERQFIGQIQLLHVNSPFRVLFYCSSEQVIFVDTEYLDIDEFAFFYEIGRSEDYLAVDIGRVHI